MVNSWDSAFIEVLRELKKFLKDENKRRQERHDHNKRFVTGHTRGQMQ
jgi:hypothetical protein